MEEALIKRILPHSIEAEQSVIGSMIMNRDAIVTASEIITGDDFYQQQYGIVFEAMVELYNENKPVDLVTLQNRLKELDVPPEISSMEFVGELVAAVPTSVNVKYYAEIVSEKAMLRKLIWSSMRSRRLRRHPGLRGVLRVSPQDLLIWITRCPVSSRRI